MPTSLPLVVVSVSLGSSRRDTDQTITFLGHQVRFRRMGVDGNLGAAVKLVGELDGKVSAIGLGGIDLYVPVRERRYFFKDAKRMASAAKRTPVVCGAGLKDSLERSVVARLAPEFGFAGAKVLMVSAVDRFGMAQAFVEQGADVTFGDLMFALGIGKEIKSLATLERLARILLPVVTRVPFAWLYPLGDKQNAAPQERFRRVYDEADVIAGDWHFLKRYAPAALPGKIVLTNTTTAEDLEFLRSRGVKTLITTTLRLGERSIGTNLLEAAMVAVEGASGELTRERYLQLIDEAGLVPSVIHLAPEGAPGQVVK